MPGEVLLLCDGGEKRRAIVRQAIEADTRVFVGAWAPLLERGPAHWLDSQWRWDNLLDESQLAFSTGSELLVLVDVELAGQIWGVVATSGPHEIDKTGLDEKVVGLEKVLWLEYIAIAPALRKDCPESDRSAIKLRGLGAMLMRQAIERSQALGCQGRIALHAEGGSAIAAYERWEMQCLPEAPHPAGGAYPIYFGDQRWAEDFLAKGERK